jgi:hypothetical protein
MATTGAAAWQKYYQGKGNVSTTIRTAGYAFDPEGKPTGIMLTTGTPVVVLASKEYDSKPLIEVKFGTQTKKFRFKFADLTKPGNKASAAASLKPQAFNVVDVNLTLPSYKPRVIQRIESREDLTAELRSYLSLLIDYWGGNDGSKTKLAKLYPQIKDKIPINDINKDFGEVIGPLACIKHSVLSKANIKVTASSKIYIPSRPNEPLLDYKIDDYAISAKSGKTTNTVKGSDILMLLEKPRNSKVLQKYNDTDEYKILKILTENNVLEGPIAALTSLLGTDKFNKFVEENTYLKSKKDKYTRNELMYESEKALQAESKNGSLNFTKMFADAIRGNIVYVKFELDNTGKGSFETTVADDLEKADSGKRPYLRSKNGYTRKADKMGIQI